MSKKKINSGVVYQKTNNWTLLFLVASFIVTIVVFTYIRTSDLLPGQDFDNDVYYHIKAGDLFSYFATTKEFPWTEMSIWKTTFYDKELGFHGIIFLLRRISEFLGLSMNPPFNFIDIFFVFTILLTFSTGAYIFCKKASVFAPVLLVFISPLFLVRLSLVRPHMVSIIFFMLACYLMMSNFKMNTKCILSFLIAWIYAYFYSSPQLVLLPLLVYAVAHISHIRTIKSLFVLLLLPCGALGIIAALLFHPQFSNTFILWNIQGVDVLKTMFQINKAKIGIGYELLPPGIEFLKQNILIFALLLINIILFILNKERTERLKFIVFLQALLFLGFIFSIRFIEYAAPIGVLSFIYSISTFCPKNEAWSFIPKISYFRVQAILGAIILIIMAPVAKTFLSNQTRLVPLYDFAQWASGNIKKGSYIGLLNWGDFPRIFYLTQDYRMSGALEPMFSYYAYPEKTEKIEMFRMGISPLSPAELKSAFGTNLVYASKYDHVPVMYLLDHGASLLYYDKEGCLLELE